MSTSNKSLLELRRQSNQIWSHVRGIWLDETPEERVRQEYLLVIVNEYGFKLDQLAEEVEVTGHRGGGHARADFVIWRTAKDKIEQLNPLIIVECKSDNVTISARDYWQGDSYSRLTGARFLITHNNRETRYWRVIHEKMPKSLEEIENVPHADSTDKEIDELISRLKVFKEDEFADLLHQCHNVIRNREKKDPAAAFDEIAKILFIKVFVERQMFARRQRQNIFTVDYLKLQFGDDPIQELFAKTKQAYAHDKIFDGQARINLKPTTTDEIVRLLERYNLSDTSEDIKGIAFERFLGRTFRGELGQFFTPRSIVEFMIRMVDPQEGQTICDPASGSGGFLIRFFEIVREKILADADKSYQTYRNEIEVNDTIASSEKAKLINTKYLEIQRTIDQTRKGSRLWALANKCIFGTDASERMARTSKMNMIMHGDGHGGVHHHDGFLNINGIFEERFEIVLTNPPFGMNVESTDIVLASDIEEDDELIRRYSETFGQRYDEAQQRIRNGLDKPISNLFTLPKASHEKVKTEVLFIERCLDLLKPGGKLGIVLPDGIFNAPSLSYVREFVEDRSYIRAIVSLPDDTFTSAKATVTASILFAQKFTHEEQQRYNHLKRQAQEEVKQRQESERRELEAVLKLSPKISQFYPNGVTHPDNRQREEAKKALAEFRVEVTKWKDEARKRLKDLDKEIVVEGRRLLKERFNYPVFMYEADHIGITSTGEVDLNELYPNESQPAEIELTCLELFRMFMENPQSLFSEIGGD